MGWQHTKTNPNRRGDSRPRLSSRAQFDRLQVVQPDEDRLKMSILEAAELRSPRQPGASPRDLGRRDPADQVFLLGLALSADGKGIKHA
jgi:hypothetical protein